MSAVVFVGHPVKYKAKDKNASWSLNTENITRNYGDMVVMFESSEVMLEPGRDGERVLLAPRFAMSEIERILRQNKFNIEEDYFLAAGDMTMYAAMLLVSWQKFGGTPRQLRYSRDKLDYDVLKPMFKFEQEEEVNEVT